MHLIQKTCAAVLLVMAALVGGGCSGIPAASGGSQSGGYRSEARCQPPAGRLLPDPGKCPEFFEGRPGSGGGAPVVGTDPGSPSDAPPYPKPYDDDPCAHPASMNGFPCYNDPSGPVYVEPMPPDYVGAVPQH
jgi:hypothetical protein